MATLFILGMLGLGFAVYFLLNPKKIRKAKRHPYTQYGMAIGMILGSLIGIGLVEFAGYSYPMPFILMFFGWAIGSMAGVLYEHQKKKCAG